MLTTHFVNLHHIKNITFQDENYCIEFFNNVFIVFTPAAFTFIKESIERKSNDNNNRE